MPEEWEYETYARAVAAIEDAASVACQENHDLGWEDAVHDIAISLMTAMNPRTRYEVARHYIGWDPEEDGDLFKQNNIPMREER